MVNNVSFCGKTIVPCALSNKLYQKLKYEIQRVSLDPKQKQDLVLSGNDKDLYLNTMERDNYKTPHLLAKEMAKGVPVAKTLEEACDALGLKLNITG